MGGWVVTKIYSYFSLKQERFKRNFILMNQRSRQTPKNSVEKDFFNPFSNANFGYDCHNNLGNCKSAPIFDELDEINYLKRYYNFFDKTFSKFLSSELLEREAETNFNDKMIKIQKNDTFYEIKLSALNNKRKEDLEALQAFKQKQKRQKCKRTIKDYMTRHEEAQKDNKAKAMIDFGNEQTTSIKSIAIQKNSTVNLTNCFMKRKMLMFSKSSLYSFAYDIIDVFCFPEEEKTIKNIYEKYRIQKYFVYQNVTYTDSTSLFFIFVISEVLTQSKILKRLDLSDDFCWQSGVCKPELKKAYVSMKSKA